MEPEEKIPKEDPRERFRRLLDEAEKAELEATSALDITDEVLPDSEEPHLEGSPIRDPDIQVGEPITEEESVPEDELVSWDEQETTVLPVPDEEIVAPTAPPVDSDTPPPPPPLGTTPRTAPPAVDTRGMPLPRRVDELDVGGTQVTESAYQPAKTYQTPAPTVATSPGRR